MNVFLQVLTQILVCPIVQSQFCLIEQLLFQGISSDSIILRVAMGRAWTAESGAVVSSLVFGSSTFAPESGDDLEATQTVERKGYKSKGVQNKVLDVAGSETGDQAV